MRVALIEPPIMDFGGPRHDGPLHPIAMDAMRECPPYGVYLLAAVLNEAGHDTEVVDLIAEGSESVAPHLDALRGVGLIGIGATSMSWATARSVIDQLRAAGIETPIVLGGIHPTMFDEYLLRNFAVQFVVRGEGEVALPALVDALERHRDFSQIPNLSWVDGENVIRNPIAPKIDKAHLSDFPLPDYSTVPDAVYKGLAIESSRGCAFDCSFCSTSYRKTWRGMPVEPFVDRLELVMANLDRTLYNTLHIIDDEFSLNPRRATAIAHEIHARNLTPQLVYDSRATDLLWPGYVEAMADITCQFLVGAECGYDEGLQKIGKGTTCEILENAAAQLARYEISERADFSFIVGLPWETQTEAEQTIRFAMHLHANYGVRILLQWYCQIPGSRLWDEDRARHIVNETMYNDFGFFRDHYLFRSGVRIAPDAIWELADLVQTVTWLAELRMPDRRMIEFAFPEAISTFYPRATVDGTRTGLDSLREVARPQRTAPVELLPARPSAAEAATVGLPQRHFVGYQ